MVRYSKPSIALAVGLSALAGFIDARGFLETGTFVSFMSGNSTRLGIALGQSAFSQAGALICILTTFIAGVVLGTLIGHRARLYRAAVVLGGVAFLLFGAALLQHFGYRAASHGALILAMGAENALFQEEGEVTIGLTYITGTLVKMAQRIAGALIGGPKTDWFPYAGLWLGMLTGAFSGAWAAQWPYALWCATLYAVCLIPATVCLRQPNDGTPPRNKEAQ